MHIKKSIYDQILLDLAYIDYECGGIVGMKDDVICAYQKDACSTKSEDSYSPNVEYLNAAIEEWNSRDISFCGVVHNHLNGCNQLSDVDLDYFREIIRANEMDFLLCPLVTYEEGPQFDLFKIASEVEKLNIEIIE